MKKIIVLSLFISISVHASSVFLGENGKLPAIVCGSNSGNTQVDSEIAQQDALNKLASEVEAFKRKHSISSADITLSNHSHSNYSSVSSAPWRSSDNHSSVCVQISTKPKEKKKNSRQISSESDWEDTKDL